MNLVGQVAESIRIKDLNVGALYDHLREPARDLVKTVLGQVLQVGVAQVQIGQLAHSSFSTRTLNDACCFCWDWMKSVGMNTSWMTMALSVLRMKSSYQVRSWTNYVQQDKQQLRLWRRYWSFKNYRTLTRVMSAPTWWMRAKACQQDLSISIDFVLKRESEIWESKDANFRV